METAVYVLGVLTTLFCAWQLVRGYFQVKKKLLLWSGVCFAGLTISNLLVFLDLILFPNIDLYRWRLVTAAIAILTLLYGLIWESD